jgi:predicted nucleic acid-binding protein
MIVVSDTSPLNYLILIELQDILPKLFDRILRPAAVHHQLKSADAPDPIKRFLVEPPGWLEVRPSPEIDATLRQLDLRTTTLRWHCALTPLLPRVIASSQESREWR